MPRAVLLFLKYPEPGKVKTRLAATVGHSAAVEIYQRLVREVLARVPLAESDLFILYDPPERGAEIAEWIAPLCREGGTPAFRPQAAGDLGQRLERAFAEAFAAGYAEVAAIGSDCVELERAIFAATWTALADHDLVLGPTEDGGYYLIALRKPCPELFRGVAWSTPAVFRETLERAAARELHVSRLPVLSDVDTEDDWRRIESRLKR